MKKALSVIALLLAIGCHATVAQSDLPGRNFCGIECRGTMPEDMRKGLEQLYDEDQQRVKDYNNGELTNSDRVLTSSFNISRLMASARIIYGDPITELINRIADTLLKDYPELRRELRFYTVRSTEVNAFATGQGMVFVNAGLVAQVEDEAQLAFVLSHEIVHYVRKHSLENIVRREGSTDTSTEPGMASFLRYHCRSREMESEADSLGIALFYGRSNYDKQVANGFFDVLQYGYLPFDEVVFDTTRYNTVYYTISSGTFLKSVAAISAREDYNDALSTHPNLLKRRLATTRQLAGMPGGRKYVVTTKEEFEEIQMLARMECIREDLIEAEYASAYYNSDVILKKHPENEYLQYAKAKAIYGASKYRSHSASSSTSDYRNKEGEIQQVYHLFRKGKPDELCMIAIKDIWKAERELGGDSRLHEMMIDLMNDLGNRHNYKADNFSSTFDTLQSDRTTAAENDKTAKRRRRQQQRREAKRYVFTDIMEVDKGFEAMLDSALKVTPTLKASDPLGVNCFIFAPSYYIINTKTGETKIRESEMRERQLVEDMRASLEKSGLKVVDFSDGMMRSRGETEFYNDFVHLNDWTNEFANNMGKVPMHTETETMMDSLMKRYGTDMLALCIVVNREKSKRRQSTLIDAALIDTRNAKLMKETRSIVGLNDSRALIRSLQYTNIQEGLGMKKVPGYMGKHFVISGMAGLSFPILNWPFRDRTDALALRLGGELEAVIGKELSLYGSIDYGNTTFDITHETSTAEAKIVTASMGLRIYLTDEIAPLGRYISWGATRNWIGLTPTEGKFKYLEDNYGRWGMRLEFGNQRIVKESISLDFSICNDFTFANPLEELDDINYLNMSGRLWNHIRSLNANLWMYNLISLRLKIGLLPF